MNYKTTVSFTRVLSPNHNDDRFIIVNLSVLIFVTQFYKRDIYAPQTKTQTFKTDKVKLFLAREHFELLQVDLKCSVIVRDRVRAKDLVVFSLKRVAEAQLHVAPSTCRVELIDLSAVARRLVSAVVTKLVPSKLNIFKTDSGPE